MRDNRAAKGIMTGTVLGFILWIPILSFLAWAFR